MSLEFPPSKVQKKRQNSAKSRFIWLTLGATQSGLAEQAILREKRGRARVRIGGVTVLGLSLMDSKIWTDVVSEMEDCDWWTETVLPLSGGSGGSGGSCGSCGEEVSNVPLLS